MWITKYAQYVIMSYITKNKQIVLLMSVTPVFRAVAAVLACIFAPVPANADVMHEQITKKLGEKPAIVNVITIKPEKNVIIRPTYGDYSLSVVKTVEDFVNGEKALAGVNASFFKPDIGAPLGVSVIDGEVLTGPIYNRVVFGITEKNEFLMDKVEISGEIKIGKDLELNLINFNQPVFGGLGFTVFTDRWGEKTPPTGEDFCHVVVVDNRVELIKQSSVSIPTDGYVLVGPRWLIKERITKSDKVKYKFTLHPLGWEKVKYAVGGGPYLVKDGNIFVDRQKFTDKFLWRKEPRTAIGYKKDGSLVLVTVDGRQEGISEGATMTELANIMKELGCDNAMNLDGGSSTQMVYNGKLVNLPTVKGGGKVTNALLVFVEDKDE